MNTLIFAATFVVIGCYVYFKVIRPMMGANMSGLSTEAAKEFEENKDAILNSYYSDENKFGLFKQVISDENIIGITSYAEPKSIGNHLKESMKTTITNGEKVNMDLFYLVITDQSLHAVEFNGENSVDHQIFDLQDIQGMTFSKSGRLNVKDHMSGTGSGLNKMVFHYKGETYEFNIFDIMYGFPKFTVEENIMANTFSHVFCIPLSGIEAIKSKDFYTDGMVKQHMTLEFKNEIYSRFKVTY